MKILVIAPHPDDEVLGCGGTLLKHCAQGDDIYWMIITCMAHEVGHTDSQIAVRGLEIKAVSKAYHCKEVFEFGYPTTTLDTISKREMISKFADIIQGVSPDTVYLPNRSDVHSDHRVTFEVAMGGLKSFRAPMVRRIFMYEVLSETEFAPSFQVDAFIPDSFSDISLYLERKIEIMRLYKSELGNHPFPRSEESIRALATLRGATAGVKYAEGFKILKEIW